MPGAASLASLGNLPLLAFGLLVPKDRGGRRVVAGASYGDGRRRTLDVYAPRRRGRGALPIIVFFYGGGWSSGTRRGYAFVGRALAARGFLVVVPDYRLVPEVAYPAFVEDAASAVRWAAREASALGGDPDRVVLMGHSAGAYVAAMLAVDERWLGQERRRVVGFAGLAGPYDFAPFDVAASRAAFGGWPDAAETQPVNWAGPGDPPALLVVGGEDRTVGRHDSDALAARLRDGGVQVEVLTYARLDHVGLLLAISRPLRRRATVLRDMVWFARRVTGGAASGGEP